MRHLHALSLTPALPIADPNIDFDPPADGRYLRATFVPNTTDRLFIQSTGLHRYTGLFMVDVFDKPGTGETRARDVAGQVAEHFPCDDRITEEGVTLRIITRPNVGPAIIEDQAIHVPVTVEFWAFA
ncbi:DUF4128 domain-containing protein [Oricola thermophila]|uniref:DUF4128 domain-containing protein n=2 Tax=Oricola thermophila TaxID=2742145 RepID=A0A6N1VNL5_9HYPH|nr:DUF4128 domain-containing protein [Oricola thermophila]